MTLRIAKWLEDIRASAEFILDVVSGKNLDDYRDDAIIRAAVERHFEIIGEAIRRIARSDSTIAGRLGDFQRVIAFRNMLIHGYDLVDDGEVWNVIQKSLPELKQKTEKMIALLSEETGQEG